MKKSSDYQMVSASEDYPVEDNLESPADAASDSLIEKQASITAIEDDDDEAEPHRRTI